MDPNPDSGDTPAVPPPATNDVNPTGEALSNPPATGSEADINSGKEAMVPSHRVREETEARRAAEQRAEEAERKLQETEAARNQPSSNADPDVEKVLDDYAKRHGLLTKAEFDKQQQEANARIQVQQDVSELRSQYKDSGVPFDDKAIFTYMKDHGMLVTSKDSLDAAYLQMNRAKILDAAANKAVVDFKEGARSGAERPGPGGSKAPSGGGQPTGLRARIADARQRLQQAA